MYKSSAQVLQSKLLIVQSVTIEQHQHQALMM
jgi:hypothetical protein